MSYLLVPIMAVGRKDIYMNYRINNLVDESMPLRDSAAPQCSATAFEWLWLSSSRL